jgi:hypothetical protein
MSTIYCGNDPCEAEATHLVTQPGDDKLLMPLCDTCAEAFGRGQRYPKADVSQIEDCDQERNELFKKHLPFVCRIDLSDALAWQIKGSLNETLEERALLMLSQSDDVPDLVYAWVEELVQNEERIKIRISSHDNRFLLVKISDSKDYANMTKAELAEVSGWFKARGYEDEFSNLLDAINFASAIAEAKHIELWVLEWDEDEEEWTECWEIDEREDK